jgi:hypothetical protein
MEGLPRLPTRNGGAPVTPLESPPGVVGTDRETLE